MTEEQLKNDYELAFLITSAEAAASILDTLKKYQAEVIYESPINQIKLAYAIKKHTSAFFGHYQFLGLRETVKKIGDDLVLDNSVLRYLIITPPARPAVRQSRLERPQQPKTEEPRTMSNEALEQQLEEILK